MWSSTNDKNMDINLLYALGNDLVTSTTTLSVVPSTAGSVAVSTQSVSQTLLPTQTNIVPVHTSVVPGIRVHISGNNDTQGLCLDLMSGNCVPYPHPLPPCLRGGGGYQASNYYPCHTGHHHSKY